MTYGYENWVFPLDIITYTFQVTISYASTLLLLTERANMDVLFNYEQIYAAQNIAACYVILCIYSVSLIFRTLWKEKIYI